MTDDKKVITINDGTAGKKKYYLYSSYNTYEEAKNMAKLKKEEYPNKRIKYFILESEEGWFLPVNKFCLYLTKDFGAW